VEDRLAKERAEVANNPGKYVPQGIPGLVYNDRGEIIGSKPWSSTATMNDVRVDTPDYVPRPKGTNYQAPMGSLTQKRPGESISQPYNTADMYTNLMPRYYADGGNVAGGYSSGMPVHAAGGWFADLTSSVSNFLKPAEQAFNSTTNAVANVVNPSPVAVAVAPPSSFSQNPFGKLAATDFQSNADAVAREKQDRLKEIQAAYDTQNRLRQVQDDQYSAAGSARGKQMFFDPRARDFAPSIGRSSPAVQAPNRYAIASMGRESSPIQAPALRPPVVPPPARPTVRSEADTRGPVASKRTGGIANLTESRYYPRKTGQISGPGTETSDSIPAMLSDGEFVMTAKAVKALGKGDRRAGAKKMYALMHQLERNASRG
jgi:hypothetical protein